MAIAMEIRVLLLSLLVISTANLTFALYEDRVYLMDWYQQHIGKVLQAVFQTQKSVWKRVVVAAEENAIASLVLRRGDIFWRHVHGSNDVIDDCVGQVINFQSWKFSRGDVSVGIFPSDLSAVKVTAIPSLKVDEDHVMMFGRNFFQMLYHLRHQDQF